MKPPCEMIMQRFIPALRAEITIELYRESGMRQSDIANRLGTKQPSISQYLSGVRGNHHKPLSKMFPELREHAHSIAVAMMRDRCRTLTIRDCCNFCRDLRQNPDFGKFYRKASGDEWPCPD